MIGGKPIGGSNVSPQFSISMLELKNDKLEKTSWSNKNNQMNLAMPRAGFSKHCAAKLGDNLYIIGGGYRRNLIHQLNLNTKQLKLTRNVLPLGILEDRRHNWYNWHSCATFQKKIWICGPRYASRRSKNIVNKCWTFDSQNIREVENLSVKKSFLLLLLHSLFWSFVVKND